MLFIVDLRIDIRTKEMLNITPCKELTSLHFKNVSSIFFQII